VVEAALSKLFAKFSAPPKDLGSARKRLVVTVGKLTANWRTSKPRSPPATRQRRWSRRFGSASARARLRPTSAKRSTPDRRSLPRKRLFESRGAVAGGLARVTGQARRRGATGPAEAA
jgi:hypothetical protein